MILEIRHSEGPFDHEIKSAQTICLLQLAWSCVAVPAIWLNTVSLLLLSLVKSLGRTQKTYLITFGVSDLVCGIAMLLFGMLRSGTSHTHDERTCNILEWGMLFINCLDLYLLLFFSMHRTAILQWPFKTHTLERKSVVLSVIGVAVGMSLAVTATTLAMSSCTRSGPEEDTSTGRLQLAIFLLVPLVLLTATDSYLYYVVIQKRKEIVLIHQSQKASSSSLNRAVRLMRIVGENIHVAFTTLIVYVSFVVLSLPMLLLQLLTLDHPKSAWIPVYAEGFFILASAKAVVNPVLLSFRLRPVQRLLVRYFHRGTRRLTKRLRSLRVVGRQQSPTTFASQTFQMDASHTQLSHLTGHSPGDRGLSGSPSYGPTLSVSRLGGAAGSKGSIRLKKQARGSDGQPVKAPQRSISWARLPSHVTPSTSVPLIRVVEEKEAEKPSSSALESTDVSGCLTESTVVSEFLKLESAVETTVVSGHPEKNGETPSAVETMDISLNLNVKTTTSSTVESADYSESVKDATESLIVVKHVSSTKL